MHNKVGFNRLGRKAAHRNAMIRNMITSLFRYERITTTKAKALEVRKAAEKMITRAKIDSVHNRRVINKDIKDAEVLNKLFVEIGPAHVNRPGGYTRIIKKGFRQGDAAELVILEIVKDETEKKEKIVKKKKSAQKNNIKVEESKVEEPKVEEPKVEEPKEESKAVEKSEVATEEVTEEKEEVKSE